MVSRLVQEFGGAMMAKPLNKVLTLQVPIFLCSDSQVKSIDDDESRKYVLAMRAFRIICVIALAVFSFTGCAKNSSRHPAAAPPAGDRESESWYGAFLGDQRVGYMRQITGRSASGLRLYSEHFISARSLDQPIAMKMIESLDASADYRPETYFQKIDGEAGFPYKVFGTRRGNHFHLRMESGGKILKEKTIDLDEVTFPQLADRMIQVEGLEVGKSWTYTVINPVDFLPIRIEIRVDGKSSRVVNGKPRELYRVTAKLGAIEIVSLIDSSDIHPWRIEMPSMGLSYVLEDKSAAEKISADEPGNIDLAYFSAVIPTGGVLPDARISRLRVKLSGASFDGLNISGDFQRVIRADSAQTVLEISEADPGEAADSPIVFAKETVRWMQMNIRKVPTSIVPSPEDILAIRQGDCNEFSALFDSLAQKAGHPCRIISGVVHMNGGFFYHSWNEIRVGSRWIPVDPIFDEIPASAKHIRLVEGDFSSAWKLAGVIHRLKIEIVEVDEKG